MQTKKETLIIFLKGMLMGGADVIPGVSGGTMALIAGIYERLILGLKGINIKWMLPLLKGKIRESWKELMKIDFGFFIPLGLGIALAFGIGSFVITYLLDNFTAYIYAFFFGLILASVRVVQRQTKKFGISGLITIAVGFAFAFWVVGLPTLQTTPAYWFIFICGMIAICAMLLPGISGAFMLLMLGQYQFMLEALKGLKIWYICSFMAGAIISLLGSSHILAYLLKRWHSPTMGILVGLMLGALRQPFEKIVNTPMDWGALQIGLTLFFGVIGVTIVLILDRYERKHKCLFEAEK
jgi:putative membrane protein